MSVKSLFSNTKNQWADVLKPSRNNLAYWLMAIVGISYCFMLRFIPTTPQFKAILFLLFTLDFIFLVKKSAWFAVDIFFIAISTIPLGYLAINYRAIASRASSSTPMEWVFTILILLAILEATRRTTGNPLVIIALIFLAYGFLGPYMPGLLWHRGISLQRLTQNMVIVSTGIFSSPMQTAATTIVVFVIMGDLMLRLGAGDFFTRASSGFTRRLTAGRAKMSIIAGLLFGMINGSAAANVVTTGQITIPMMKDEGYSNEYAGAIAAASATGGPLSPPVMGAGAFLLAEYCGITYGEVCKISIVPAFLFYLSIFICVHFEARRMAALRRAKGEELQHNCSEEVSDARNVKGGLLVEYFHIILPLLYLVWRIIGAYSIVFTCIASMVMMILFAILNPYCPVTLKGLADAISSGIKSSLGVTAACACSGIVIGIIGTTGLGVTFTSFVMKSGMGVLMGLALTAVIVIILGMGLPGIAAYIVAQSVAVSVLKTLGVDPTSAHLFIYFFSCLAVLTPPVALTAYAAAGLSGGDPIKTGVKAVLISISGYIAPFVFSLDPALILQGGALACLYRISLTVIGVCGMALGITGYFRNHMRIFTRAALIIGGLCAVFPSQLADWLGILLVAAGIVLNLLTEKQYHRPFPA